MRTRGAGQGSASGTEFASRGKKKKEINKKEIKKVYANWSPIYTTEKTGSGPIKKWSWPIFLNRLHW